MRNISYLNINESIKKKRLIHKRDLIDKIDYYTFIFLWISSIVAIFFLIKDNYFFCLIIFIILSYFLIRKIFEYRLKIIKTNNSIELNKERVLKYINERKFELYRNNSKCIIFNESDDNFGHCTTTILFFIDDLVYYTTIKDGFKMNFPTIITHIFIKRDLKKILTKSV